LAILNKTRRRSLPCGIHINQKDTVMASDTIIKGERPSCKTTDAKKRSITKEKNREEI
jgi:hypothetical protein